MKTRHKRRRGVVLLYVVIVLVLLMMFVAFALDLGAITDAKAQAQVAADAAAIAGARTLNGQSDGNVAQATAMAIQTATANRIMAVGIQASEVSVRHGANHYDSGSQSFVLQYPPVAPDNYNVTEVTITHNVPTIFAGLFGSASTVHCTATAAHDPRDIAIVLDYSGSMNNESDLWNCETYLGTVYNTSNNTDSVFPQFGPYDPAFSPNVQLQCTSSDPRTGKSNVTVPVLGIGALVNDFYQNAAGDNPNPAFTPAPANITNTSPGGDQYLFAAKSPTTVAVNWQDIVGNAGQPPTALYNGNNGVPFGYTQGPGYWGKTFFIWPPDPRPQYDWRKQFFFHTDGTTPVDDDRLLWNGFGNWVAPPGHYVINYKAILAWIKSSPVIFPSQLRGGNVLYYDAIPDDVPASAYDHTQPNSAITDPNQRFWKEYIDYTLGVWRDPFGLINVAGSSSCSYGPDFACGSTPVQITGPDKSRAGSNPFIDPKDNPLRPRHRMWFGPMTMIQFLLDLGLMPGTAHDISLVAAKLGIAGALQDIQNNHPNDQVALIMFNRPTFSADPVGVGRFDLPRVTMGRDYAGMIDALWFPNPAHSDVRLYSADDRVTPRAHSDYCTNTATDYGLMLAYNQLSGNQALQANGMGGWGRRGAQKMVILETDGMANVPSSANPVNAGPYNSYYATAPLGTVSFSSSDAGSSAVAVATRICALSTDATGLPGFAEVRKPVLIHCIAFGAIFEPTAGGGEQTLAVNLLQQISNIGGTTFPSTSSDPANGYKWCIGTLSQRQDKLRQAFSRIVDDSVSISLIK